MHGAGSTDAPRDRIRTATLPGRAKRLLIELGDDVPGTLRQVGWTDHLLMRCTDAQRADVADDLAEYAEARAVIIAAAAQRN